MDVAAQNEEYNEILGRLISGIDVSYRDKIALSKVYYTGEGDPATKLLDVMIEKATTPEKTLKGTFSPKILESKEFQDLREGVLHFFKPMKYLYESKIVDDQFVGLGIDAFLLRKPNDLEAFSDELTKIISQSSEIDTFENIARIWEATLPDSYDIKLRKLSLSASDLEIQNSIRKVVALMGKDPTQIIQGADIIMTGGKKIEVKNNVGGFITIDGVSFFKDVIHVIHTSPELDQSTKDELEKLIERLTQELAQIPKEKVEEAETVAELTKDLVEKATKEKPNKPLVKITADGLLKAAENIGKIAPKVISIAKQIVALLLI